MNINKKLLTGLIGIAAVTIFAGMAAGEFRGAKKAEGPRIAAVTAVQKTFRLQGKFEEELSGPYDLLFKIYSNESQEELIVETTFPQVAFEGGFYTVDVDPSSLGLKQGKDYWLTIDIPETEIPTQEAKLEIVAKNTIQLNADGEDRGTITGGQDYVGNFSDYMVKITNKGTGYTIWAVSEKGTAVYAQASAPGKYAVHAENPQGTALFVDGKAKVQGDLEVTGQTSLSNVILPLDSVGTSQITDGSVGQAELAAGSVNSSKIQDAVIMDADIAGNANIEASKVNRSGLDADLFDGNDSTKFAVLDGSGNMQVNGNLSVNGTGNNYFAGNVGIGTMNPATKLYVGNGAGTVLYVTDSGLGDDGDTFHATLEASGDLHAQLYLEARGGSRPGALRAFYDTTNAVNQGWLGTIGSHNLGLGVDNSTNLLIDVNGNVGIGANSPAEKLHVDGNIGIPTSLQSNRNGGMIRGVSYWGDPAKIPAAIEFRRDNDTYTGEEGRIIFRTTDVPTALAPERMVITGPGNVGIGRTVPAEKLHVDGNIGIPTSHLSNSNGGMIRGVSYWGESAKIPAAIEFRRDNDQYTGEEGRIIFRTTNVPTALAPERMVITGLGDVGIGMDPQQKLDVAGQIHATGDICTDVGGKCLSSAGGGGIGGNGTAHFLPKFTDSTTIGNSVIYDNGSDIGIGTTNIDPSAKLQVNGKIIASGPIVGTNVTAHYQDLAEWAPSTQELTPATVVSIDTANNNHVVASTQAYDSKVAGVVSKQPGFILGEGGEGQYMIAHTGRVKVKVDARYGAIAIGDLLVASPVEGTAMKSEPMIIKGRSIHQPGTILGKALEPLSEGQGEILVLLSLQ